MTTAWMTVPDDRFAERHQRSCHQSQIVIQLRWSSPSVSSFEEGHHNELCHRAKRVLIIFEKCVSALSFS
jgi:hypothetical protein